MNAEILCIGTEVLLGDVVNTNAAFLGKKLSENGFNVYHHTVCGDNRDRMTDALRLALSRSALVLVTGGLGPTYDDITKEVTAELFGLALVEHAEILARLEAYFAARGRVMTPNNRKQALIPEGAHIFENRHGTADGLAVSDGKQTVILLPGPPREMQPMFEEQVLPYLASYSDHILVSSNVHIFGMGESSVENALYDLMTSAENPTVAPYVNDGEVRLRVTARAANREEAQALIAPIVEKITATLGDAVYGVDVPSVEYVLVKELARAHKTIAFAESCTGGLISKRLTDVPGASEVFGYGFVTYANEAKAKLIGVSEQTLAAHGAVSPETAKEMAEGARRVSGADIAVAVTGLAGPGGGTAEKPVGLVYMGVASEAGTEVHKLLLGGHKGAERAYIRTLTATHAFKAALDVLKKERPTTT